MSRKEALTELLAKAETGTFSHDPHELGTSDWAKMVLGVYSGLDFAADAYRGSLDAANALHKAVLPGWKWVVAGDRSVVLTGPLDEIVSVSKADSHDPARAWLIAILKALIAECEE